VKVVGRFIDPPRYSCLPVVLSVPELKFWDIPGIFFSKPSSFLKLIQSDYGFNGHSFAERLSLSGDLSKCVMKGNSKNYMSEFNELRPRMVFNSHLLGETKPNTQKIVKCKILSRKDKKSRQL
jgi:hypothetical protein